MVVVDVVAAVAVGDCCRGGTVSGIDGADEVVPAADVPVKGDVQWGGAAVRVRLELVDVRCGAVRLAVGHAHGRAASDGAAVGEPQGELCRVHAFVVIRVAVTAFALVKIGCGFTVVGVQVDCGYEPAGVADDPVEFRFERCSAGCGVSQEQRSDRCVRVGTGIRHRDRGSAFGRSVGVRGGQRVGGVVVHLHGAAAVGGDGAYVRTDLNGVSTDHNPAERAEFTLADRRRAGTEAGDKGSAVGIRTHVDGDAAGGDAFRVGGAQGV